MKFRTFSRTLCHKCCRQMAFHAYLPQASVRDVWGSMSVLTRSVMSGQMINSAITSMADITRKRTLSILRLCVGGWRLHALRRLLDDHQVRHFARYHDLNHLQLNRTSKSILHMLRKGRRGRRGVVVSQDVENWRCERRNKQPWTKVDAAPLGFPAAPGTCIPARSLDCSKNHVHNSIMQTILSSLQNRGVCRSLT